MKKNILRYTIAVAILVSGGTACNKALDLKPINEISDADFWKSAEQFKLAANQFYGYMATFAPMIFDNPHADDKSDLATRGNRIAFSNGTNTVPLTDGNWNTAFTRIRETNYLLSKAAEYSNADEIKQYVAEAKFFRAYTYFDLLQQYGQVPIIKKPLDINSPELYAPRSARDSVVDFIMTDLEEALTAVRLESAIPGADKGRISTGAVQSMLARVALYEGTWQKFRSNTARANTLLDKAITNSNAVITSNQYNLFGVSGASAALGDSAYKYLFVLENEKSNPLGIGKAENKEYILANRYDYKLRQVRSNITHSVLGNVLWVTRKMANMYLSKDGLPVSKSPLFQGYATTTSEYIDRDSRMRYSFMMDGRVHWDNENISSRVTWLGDAQDIAHSKGVHNGGFSSGYQPQKWATERNLQDNEESYDYPVIRLAEVLLTYAEAKFERDGTISDADLDRSLNLVRNRVNKTMPKLSNAFVAANGLDMRTEIRRERTVELFLEGFRIDDLKRWKTAEVEMPMPLLGIKWTGTQWQTKWTSLSSATKDAEGAYIIEPASSRKWEQKHYLLPIPSQQIQLNPNLKPNNPGWE